MKRAVLVAGAALAVAACGSGSGDDTPPSTAAPSKQTAAAQSPQSAATTTPRPLPGVPASDPRCTAAAEDVTATVAAGLSTAGYNLTNGTVITQDGVTYFGATIVDAAGKMKSRSDVWVLRDGKVYASTGGARRESTFPKADQAGVSPGDGAVQAVDNCVVNATR